MLNTFKLLQINNSGMVYTPCLELRLNTHNSHRFATFGRNPPNESNLSTNNSFLDISNEFNKP